MDSTINVEEIWDKSWGIEVDEIKQLKGDEYNLTSLRQSSRSTKANPEGENADWWYINGRKFVNNWIEWRKNSGWKIWTTPTGEPGIELIMEVEMGGIPFKGAIDRIFVTADGELVILDLKTGMRTPQTDLQLQVYACMMERTYGIRPSWGCYWMARTGATSPPVNLNEFTLRKLDEMVALFQKAREEQLYLPNFDGCKMCSLTEYCYWVNGEKHLPLGELEIINVN
jgi:putative RecB family exonuclease